MDNSINIAFCFDHNLWMQAGVAITSLLISSQNKYAYHIYCIVSDDVDDYSQTQLANLVHKYSINSTIIFKQAGDIFKEGYVYKYKIIEDYSTDNTKIEYEGNFKVDNISQYQNEKRIMNNYENRDIRNHIYKYKIGNNIYTEKCDTGYIYKYKNGK